MPLLQREWGDTVKDTTHEAEDMADVLHEAKIMGAKHNNVSSVHSYKTKLKIEARKKEEERKKKHMQTIHNTVSKNLLNDHIAVGGYSVKLAKERVSNDYGSHEHSK